MSHVTSRDRSERLPDKPLSKDATIPIVDEVPQHPSVEPLNVETLHSHGERPYTGESLNLGGVFERNGVSQHEPLSPDPAHGDLTQSRQ